VRPVSEAAPVRAEALRPDSQDTGFRTAEEREPDSRQAAA